MIFRRLEGRQWKLADAPAGSVGRPEDHPIQSCLHCHFWSQGLPGGTTGFDRGRCDQLGGEQTHRFYGVSCLQFKPKIATQ